MIFLIEYDRAKGHIVKFVQFSDSDRAKAEESRLDLELSLKSKGIEHEVVLLDAMTEEALRQTHRRYFESLDDLANPKRMVGG